MGKKSGAKKSATKVKDLSAKTVTAVKGGATHIEPARASKHEGEIDVLSRR